MLGGNPRSPDNACPEELQRPSLAGTVGAACTHAPREVVDNVPKSILVPLAPSVYGRRLEDPRQSWSRRGPGEGFSCSVDRSGLRGDTNVLRGPVCNPIHASEA